jgi:hypothetical protein
MVIYTEMLSKSVPVAEAPPELAPLVPEDAVAVFVGNLLPLIRWHLGMTSTETYHSRKSELVTMGCIVQLRRGSRFRTGAWALIRPPTYDLWLATVARPFSRRREVELVERHLWAVEGFLRTAGQQYPALVREAVEVGATTGAEFLAYLGGLPEVRLRRLFPAGEVCLGYAVAGAVHTCLVPDLDPAVPGRLAGAWKRRADHLATLAAEYATLPVDRDWRQNGCWAADGKRPEVSVLGHLLHEGALGLLPLLGGEQVQ